MIQSKTKYRFEQSASGDVHKLYVYDSVRANGKFNWATWEYEESETSAKYFRDRLNEIPNNATIELHVNSSGGEVSEGTAIYNLLRQKAGEGCKIIGYVDGSAYSVAMTIVMACDEIHMGLGTSMFLHNPWAFASGNATELRSVADQLDVLATASRKLYLERAKDLTEEDIKQMMDVETMLDPETCLKYGFCDFIGENIEDPDEAEDIPDDKDRQIAQLKVRLFNQEQLKEFIQVVTNAPAGGPKEPVKKPGKKAGKKKNVKQTLTAAFCSGK